MRTTAKPRLRRALIRDARKINQKTDQTAQFLDMDPRFTFQIRMLLKRNTERLSA